MAFFRSAGLQADLVLLCLALPACAAASDSSSVQTGTACGDPVAEDEPQAILDITGHVWVTDPDLTALAWAEWQRPDFEVNVWYPDAPGDIALNVAHETIDYGECTRAALPPDRRYMVGIHMDMEAEGYWGGCSGFAWADVVPAGLRAFDIAMDCPSGPDGEE